MTDEPTATPRPRWSLRKRVVLLAAGVLLAYLATCEPFAEVHTGVVLLADPN